MTDMVTSWHKSSRSSQQSACVEVGSAPNMVGIRDTKDRDGGTLTVSRDTWSAFLNTIKGGRLGS